jgi:hypothetical protein
MRPNYDQPSKPGNFKRNIRILLPCTKEWVEERDVDIENIEEDRMGQDVVTFRCPHCAEYHKSKRFA